MIKFLMATCLLAFVGSATAAAPVFFAATVEGELTIDRQGKVVEVSLADADWMGEAVVAGYEQKIRTWRFAPVLEDGKPVTALGRMELSLVAVRDEASGTAHFAIDRVHFPEDPRVKAVEANQEPRRLPVYPDDAARNGVGARVMLVARVGADGLAEDIAVERLLLTGPNPGAHAKRLGLGFERTALAAARHWRTRGVEAGSLVRMPVHYSMAHVAPSKPGWERVYLVQRKSPQWLAEAQASGEPIVELAGNGDAPASKLRLLTRLEPGLEG